MLHFGARANALQDVRESHQGDVLGRNADEHADRDRLALARPPDGAGGISPVADFAGHLHDLLAGFGAYRGMIGEAPRHGGAGQTQSLREQLLVDRSHRKVGR